MQHSFDVAAVSTVEVRSDQRGGPRLHGVMIQEGRAGDTLAEVFAPGSVLWPSDGVRISIEHDGFTEVVGHPFRTADGEIRISAPATPAIEAAVAAGKQHMSVSFHALESRTTESGIREITRAIVPRAALTDHPVYMTTKAEIRSTQDRLEYKRRLWL